MQIELRRTIQTECIRQRPNETGFFAIGFHLSRTEADPASFLIETTGTSQLHGSKLRPGQKTELSRRF